MTGALGPLGAVPAAAIAVPRPRVLLGYRKWALRTLAVLLLAVLLYVSLRNAPLADIGRVLRELHLWQIALLLVLDAIIYSLVTARWWLVVRAERPSIRYLPMIAVRLSVFAVSYFTLGPQVGGEPLQVYHLQKRYGLSYTRAAASVVMDKLFELLGNFVLLSFGMLAMLHSGLLSDTGVSTIELGALALLISWPLVHIVLLYRRKYPLSWFLGHLAGRWAHHKMVRFVRASEHLAGQFCQRHPKAMLGGLGVSLLAAAATVSEYALITSSLDIRLSFWQLVTAWTTGWLSFLVPIPGGLGALEASQVSVLGLFGVSAAAAISVALIMRGRDLFICALGLLFAGNSARRL